MKHGKIKTTIVFMSLIIFIGTIVLTGCEPAPKVDFINERDEDVTVYIAAVKDNRTTEEFTKLGEIPARSTEAHHITFLGDDFVTRIQIRDSAGNELSTHDYAMADLEQQDNTVVITP